MSAHEQPASNEDLAMQAKLRGQRDRGDAWVIAEDGKRYWGLFGAAGLLAVDPARGVLMQHRVAWSDHGGTWGIPGGAINEGEAAIDGAVREAQEEAGVPGGACVPHYTHVVDRGGWTYTTVIAHVVTPFEPEITDPESLALEWVELSRVETLPLHPGFAAAWPNLRTLIEDWLAGDAGQTLTRLRDAGLHITAVA